MIFALLVVTIVSAVVVPYLGAQVVNLKDRLKSAQDRAEYWQDRYETADEDLGNIKSEVMSLKKQMKDQNMEIVEVAPGEKIADAIKMKKPRKKKAEPPKLADNQVDDYADDRFGNIE